MECPITNSGFTLDIYIQDFRFFCLGFFGAVAILAVIIMWLLAKHERQINFRESANYKSIMYCIYNVWAVLTGVSVPQKPI